MSFIRWAFRVIWKRIQQTSTWERTETVLLSVTEALQIEKAYSKSSVLILLHLSAAFDTVNHQILLTTLSSLGITGIILNWLESYLNGRSFKVAWGGEVSTEHQLITGVPPGSVLWTPPLLHIHYITGSHHTSTWFLIPLLYWWHTALSLISSRWSNGSCTDLRLPGWTSRHEWRTSPTAQPGIDWASCLPCHSNSTAWLHHPVRFFYNYPIKLSHKSWCNLRWPADFQRPRCKNCSVQALVIYRLDYCSALLAGLPLLPLTQNLHPLQKSEICKQDTPRGAITERHIITLLNVFIYRYWLVEWTSHPHPEFWIPNNFQAAPENSSLPSSLNLILKKLKNIHSLSLTLLSFP